ncbi:response regulator transcription factor [Streptomyces sp. NPDC013457]|uniref:response regulator transcription factor n=1 Tax=Streptomyces sp. NPDC013457 TaxID=3364866 RepID=UPI0036F514DE
MSIDVLVFDELHLSRASLTALLDRRGEIRVAGAVDTNRAALEFAELCRPDVTIMSYEGRDDETIEIAEKISSLPDCRTLLLATACTRSVVRRAFTGEIAGMVRRNVSPGRFLEAIRMVHQGERVFDAALTVAAVANEDCPLSVRQLSVLELLSRGDTVVEIAGKLCLSEGTVRNYLSDVVTKLGVRNRIDALRVARDAHWI